MDAEAVRVHAEIVCDALAAGDVGRATDEPARQRGRDRVRRAQPRMIDHAGSKMPEASAAKRSPAVESVNS